MKILKKCSLVIATLVILFIIFNLFDSRPSAITQSYLDKMESYSIEEGFVNAFEEKEALLSNEEQKDLGKGVNQSLVRCFLRDSCSAEELVEATQKSGEIVMKHYRHIKSLEAFILKFEGSTIKKTNGMRDSLIFGFYNLFKLKLLDLRIKKLGDFDKEKFLEEIRRIDKFILKSVSSPNVMFPTIVMLRILKTLRELAPSVQFEKLDRDLIFKNVKFGEFVTTVNTVKEMSNLSFFESLKNMYETGYPFFLIMENKTLNLYTKNLDALSQKECIDNKDEDCLGADLQQFSLINPIGRMVVNITASGIDSSLSRLQKSIDEINSL